MSSEPAPVITSADVEVQEETAKDVTKWNLIDFSSNETGRRSIQNVLTEQPGLTHYAIRMIKSPLSAFQEDAPSYPKVYRNESLKSFEK